MPGNRIPTPFYSPDEVDILRLSSKSHWDVPVKVDHETVHFLVAHPTPPVFDRPEDRTVFWPVQADPLFRLTGVFDFAVWGPVNGFPTSDHRLVWADVDVEGRERH